MPGDGSSAVLPFDRSSRDLMEPQWTTRLGPSGEPSDQSKRAVFSSWIHSLPDNADCGSMDYV